MGDEVVIPLTVDSRGAVDGAGRAGQAVRTVGQEATRTRGLISRLGDAFKTLGVLAPIAAFLSLRQAFRQVGQAVRSAGMQDIVDRRLAQAIRNTGGEVETALPKLKELANELQRTTNFSNEQVQAGQALLLSFRETAGPEGAEMLTRSMADLAAGASSSTGRTMDLTQAAQMMGRAMTQGIGALRRAGISMSEAEEAAFNAAEGLDRVAILAGVIEANYGGMAEAVADPMTQLRNAVGELSKAFGEELLPHAVAAARSITEFVQRPNVIAFFRNLGKFVVNLAVGAFEVARAMVQVGRAMIPVEEVMRIMGKDSGTMDVLNDVIARQIQMWTDYHTWLLRVAQAWEHVRLASARARSWLATLAGGPRSVIEQANAQIADAQSKLANLADMIDHNSGAGERYIKKVAEQNEELDRLAATLAGLQGELGDTSDSFDGLGASVGGAGDHLNMFERRVLAARDALLELREVDFFTALAMTQQAQALERAARARQDMLENILGDGMTGRDAITDAPGIGALPDSLGVLFSDEWFQNLEDARESLEAVYAAAERREALEGLHDAFGDMAAGMADTMGRNAAAFKVLAIAEATIAAYLAASKALAAGGPLGVARAVALLGYGMRLVGQIRQIAIPGGYGASGGGASSGSIGGVGSVPMSAAQGSGQTPVNVNNSTSINVTSKIESVDGFRIRTMVEDAARINRRGTGH